MAVMRQFVFLLPYTEGNSNCGIVDMELRGRCSPQQLVLIMFSFAIESIASRMSSSLSEIHRRSVRPTKSETPSRRHADISPTDCLARAASSGAGRVRGVSPRRLTPRNTPPMSHENGTQGAEAVGPASPSGHYVEAPAAALIPLIGRREFPKSRRRPALC